MGKITKTTESDSRYDQLEKQSTLELLSGINREDHEVPKAIKKVLPKIQALVDAFYPMMKKGGRLFYLGAGTSGRLGIVDASECPPTFGVPQGLVVGLIAGGDNAIRKAVEFAEDDLQQGWKDLQAHKITKKDVVIGIAASGSTPYVIGALKNCRKKGILTACICCNKNSELSTHADFPVEVVVGPEFVTGSTRMKSGTAQKLVLNMISTTLMIKLGRVKGNKMVDMQLSNNKLVERGTLMLMRNTGIKNKSQALDILLKHGSVRRATEMVLKSKKK